MESSKNNDSIKSDIKSLMMDPLNFSIPLAKKEIVFVLVRKPKTDFCRVHSGKEYRTYINAINVKQENVDAIYIISPDIVPFVIGIRVYIYEVLVCTTRSGGVFLWLIKLPDSDKNPTSWNLSERECAKLAEDHWIKIESDRPAGRWNAICAVADLGEPRWPDMPLAELVEKAFIDRIITNLNHPVLKIERGEL